MPDTGLIDGTGFGDEPMSIVSCSHWGLFPIDFRGYSLSLRDLLPAPEFGWRTEYYDARYLHGSR